MSDWSTLPLLPLRCILDYLSPEDAVKAMSTCRHWRNAVLLYEGRRDTLKLNIKQLEKCKFLACLFKKNVRRLHLYIDCNEPEIEKFMNQVFPLFFDTSRLQELLFVGPSYVQQSNHVPFIKLRRIQIESLIYKNTLSLQKLGFMGCSLGTPKNEIERQHNSVEQYSRALKFDCIPSPADKILTRANQCVMQFTKIRHIIADIDQINTSSLETLSGLGNLSYLSINITNRKLPDPYHSIDWIGLIDYYETPLRVAVNIIGVPYRRFDDIIHKILVGGMPLISLKVMFCKSLYTPLISHVSRLYQNSLREVMWVDSPYDSTDPYHRIVRPVRHNQADTYAHVNPFVLMCWQCASLQRLVIHGYWIWQYDVLGFVRLRKDLRHLEVSAIYYRQDRFQNFINSSEEGAIRVLCGDSPPPVDAEHIREVNEFIEYPWIPTRWSELHPALRARASSQQRADYVLAETCSPLGMGDGSQCTKSTEGRFHITSENGCMHRGEYVQRFSVEYQSRLRLHSLYVKRVYVCVSSRVDGADLLYSHEYKYITENSCHPTESINL